MALEEDHPTTTLLKLQSACSDLKTLLRASEETQDNLGNTDSRFHLLQGSLSTASRGIAPLQSLAMSRKALDTRITRALAPALALLNTFKLTECLQNSLVELSTRLSSEKPLQKRLERLLEYTKYVDQLNEGLNNISDEVEVVIQKLQEVVEFISRTKAADQYREARLREALGTLKGLYEIEVDEMRFQGLLDQALVHVQDEFEGLLLRIKHRNFGDLVHQHGDDFRELGSELEIEVLRRISTTLAANDCLDICIDIYVKVINN